MRILYLKFSVVIFLYINDMQDPTSRGEKVAPAAANRISPRVHDQLAPPILYGCTNDMVQKQPKGPSMTDS